MTKSFEQGVCLKEIINGFTTYKTAIDVFIAGFFLYEYCNENSIDIAIGNDYFDLFKATVNKYMATYYNYWGFIDGTLLKPEYGVYLLEKIELRTILNNMNLVWLPNSQIGDAFFSKVEKEGKSESIGNLVKIRLLHFLYFNYSSELHDYLNRKYREVYGKGLDMNVEKIRRNKNH